MANCPNCGRKLHFSDWRPNCPDCHVNMVYFKSNDRLLAEAEAAEIAHAKFQPSIDRAKASFFGSSWAIARIVLSLLPITGLFLPVVKMATESMNAIGILKFISKCNFGELFGGILKGDMFGVCVLTFLISVVMILVCLICSVMSLGKHGILRNAVLNLFMVINAVISCICLSVSGKGSIGVGAFVYIGLMAVLTVYNYWIRKTGKLKIHHTPCLIGGLPSEEYFTYVEQGMSDIEIRKKMVEALTKMQNEVREAARKAEQEEFEKRANRRIGRKS